MSDDISTYPASYTDRELMESIWRKIDGLAHMIAPLITTKVEPPAVDVEVRR